MPELAPTPGSAMADTAQGGADGTREGAAEGGRWPLETLGNQDDARLDYEEEVPEGPALQKQPSDTDLHEAKALTRLEARLDFLTQRGLCLKCKVKGHLAKDCRGVLAGKPPGPLGQAYLELDHAAGRDVTFTCVNSLTLLESQGDARSAGAIPSMPQGTPEGQGSPKVPVLWLLRAEVLQDLESQTRQFSLHASADVGGQSHDRLSPAPALKASWLSH